MKDAQQKSLRLVDLAESLRSRYDLEGLLAIFPDRWGGVSEAPFSTLNLGFSTGDDENLVRENRHRLVTACGITLDQVVVPGQIHGAELARVSRQDGGEGANQPSSQLSGKDVLILEEPGVFVLSLAADCPLVGIADPRTKRAGVAHCGWRGTAAGALLRLLEAIEPGSEAVAVLSPAISGDQYPVGNEVLEAIQAIPGGSGACQGERVDLRTVLVSQLRLAGFSGDRIAIDQRCSATDPGLFSYRRDGGRTGRGGVLFGWKF